MKSMKMIVALFAIFCFRIASAQDCIIPEEMSGAGQSVKDRLVGTVIFGRILSVNKMVIERTDEHLDEMSDFVEQSKKIGGPSGPTNMPSPPRENKSVAYSPEVLKRPNVLRITVQVTKVFKGNLGVGDNIHIDGEISAQPSGLDFKAGVYDKLLNTECIFFLRNPFAGFEYRERSRNTFEESGGAKLVENDFRCHYGWHIAIIDLMTSNLENLTESGKLEFWLRSFRPPFEEYINGNHINAIREWWINEERPRYKLYDEYTLGEGEKARFVKELK